MPYNAIEELKKIPPRLRPVQREGRHGWWVRILRKCLEQVGYAQARAADNESQFDEELRTVVEAFQTAQGLTVDGVVGPATYAKLLEEPTHIPLSDIQDGDDGVLILRGGIVKVARYFCDELKIRERGKANHGPMVEALLDFAEGSPGMPWCAACASTIVSLGYLINDRYAPNFETLSCSRLIRWAQQHSRLRADPLDVQPGDFWVMRGGPTHYRHVGIVESIRPEGGVNTIEGNTRADPVDIAADAEGDGIYRRQRFVSAQTCAIVNSV